MAFINSQDYICKPNCQKDLNGFCVKCKDMKTQAKGIMEQIEDIQKLAEKLENDSRKLSQEIFSFENINKICKPYYLD